MAILIALALIKYLSKFFNPIKFIMTYLSKLIASVFIWLTLILIFTSLIFAIMLMTFLSYAAYGYNNYFQSLVGWFWLFTWGSLFYEYKYVDYTENEMLILQKTSIAAMLVFIVSFHFFVRYVIINHSVAFIESEHRKRREPSEELISQKVKINKQHNEETVTF